MIDFLQDKVASLRRQLMDSEQAREKLSVREKELQSTLASLKLSMKDQHESAESEHRAKLTVLETELQKQRERCLTLIEEKEDEVSMLKSNMELAFEKAFTSADGRMRDNQLRMAAATTIANTGKL